MGEAKQDMGEAADQEVADRETMDRSEPCRLPDSLNDMVDSHTIGQDPDFTIKVDPDPMQRVVADNRVWIKTVNCIYDRAIFRGYVVLKRREKHDESMRFKLVAVPMESLSRPQSPHGPYALACGTEGEMQVMLSRLMFKIARGDRVIHILA